MSVPRQWNCLESPSSIGNYLQYTPEKEPVWNKELTPSGALGILRLMDMAAVHT